MSILKDFWVHGMMPVQLLIVMGIAFLMFVIGQHLLKRFGLGIPAFGQAILIWFTGFSIFKFVIFPPLPASLLYTYLALMTIAVYLFISSTEKSWVSFQKPILSTIRSNTLFYKGIRMAVFIILPLVAYWGTFNYLKPIYEKPVELRTDHPAPPAKIVIHEDEIDLQTARNPFRTNGSPVYNYKKSDSSIVEN